MIGCPISERFAADMRKIFALEDQHADETKIETEPEIFCANCNATEQGFDLVGGVPVCRICGRECRGAE